MRWSSPWTKRKNATLDDTGRNASENPSKNWEWYCYYDLGRGQNFHETINSCRTSRNHDLKKNFQPVANWVAAIYWGWSMITKKPWESLSTLNQPERDDRGFGRPPGHPMVTSGHPAIGSPWSCWGIRDRAVEWCEKRETWGAQLVACLHKILTCKKNMA